MAMVIVMVVDDDSTMIDDVSGLGCREKATIIVGYLSMNEERTNRIESNRTEPNRIESNRRKE